MVWLLLGLVLLFGGLYVAAHYLAGDKVPAQHDRLRRPHRRAPAGRGGPAAAGRAGRQGRARHRHHHRRHSRSRSTPPRRACRSTTTPRSPRRAARTAGTRSGCGTTSPAVTPSRRETTVDDATFNAYLAGLDEQYGAPARDGAIGFDGSRVVTRKARTGAALDPAETLAALRAAFLEETPDTVPLEMADVVPDIDAGRRPGGARRLRLPGGRGAGHPQLRRLRRQDLPRRLHRGPQPRADRRRAGADLDAAKPGRGRRLPGHQRRPGRRDRRTGRRQARRSIPAKPGVTFDEAELEAGFLAAVAKPQGERTLALTAQVAKAGVHHQGRPRAEGHRAGVDLHDLLPLRRLPQRQPRPGRRADQRHPAQAGGDVLPQRHRRGAHVANGFTKGYIISDGILVQDLGGGVSQIATTTFNAMFFAGPARTSSTSRTRSTSTATRSGARPRSPGARSTCASPTTRPTAS